MREKSEGGVGGGRGVDLSPLEPFGCAQHDEDDAVESERCGEGAEERGPPRPAHERREPHDETAQPEDDLAKVVCMARASKEA